MVVLGCTPGLRAEVPIVEPVLSEPTGIAPYYFGPNAFPIPDMLDGRTSSTMRLELAGDYYAGFQRDWTADIFARIRIPLWTTRVNLSLWMPVMEWYSMSPERQLTCRLQQPDTVNLCGYEAGDVYISTDIQLLRGRQWAPDIALRLALKTASGGSFARARYYDNPGYFFDLSLGKSWYFHQGQWTMGGEQYPNPEPRDLELRLAGSAGFLCWQTDNGRQNDAVMYGLQFYARYRFISLRTTWGGYVGWERHGDQPMSIKAVLAGHVRGFEPFVQYQYGIQDYPFHQLRLGLVYNIQFAKLQQ